MFRSRFIVCSALLLMFMWLVCAASSAMALGKGSQGADVAVVQGILKSLGFYKGQISGYYTGKTADAVKQFQRKYGLRVTGAVDDPTLRSLLWAYAAAKNLNTAPAPSPKRTPKLPEDPKPPEVPQPSPEPDETRKPDETRPESRAVPELSADERHLVDLANTERDKQGLGPLAVDPALVQAARLKSQDMLRNHYFAHVSQVYGSPFEMMEQMGIPYTYAGENITCGKTAEQAHAALMNTNGYRANILSADHSLIGVGLAEGSSCGKLFTELFVGR